jgi:hypothetical protein
MFWPGEMASELWLGSRSMLTIELFLRSLMEPKLTRSPWSLMAGANCSGCSMTGDMGWMSSFGPRVVTVIFRSVGPEGVCSITDPWV